MSVSDWSNDASTSMNTADRINSGLRAATSIAESDDATGGMAVLP